MKLFNLIKNSIDADNYIEEHGIKKPVEKIYKETARTINYLVDLELPRNSRVILISDNSLLGYIFITAASALGLEIVLPYNLASAVENEWEDLISICKPNAIIYTIPDNKLHNALLKKYDTPIYNINLDIIAHHPTKLTKNICEKNYTQNFLILFTSGTTAKPKAISISEKLVFSKINSVSEKLEFKQGSNILLSGLINNTTGFIFYFGALLKKSNLYFPTSNDHFQWAKTVENKKITHLMLRPKAMESFLLGKKEYSANTKTLQVVAYGAAPLATRILENAINKLGCKFIQGYGLSETFGPFCWLNAMDHQNLAYKGELHCIGRPDSTVEMKILESNNTYGELIIESENIMNGYYDKTLTTIIQHNNIINTGDIIQRTNNGLIFLKGRSSSTILSANGHIIFPEEIEKIILDKTDLQALVLSRRIAESAEIILCIKCSKDSFYSHKKEIELIISNELSAEKWPNKICCVDQDFKINSNGKINRQQAAEIFTNSKIVQLELGE